MAITGHRIWRGLNDSPDFGANAQATLSLFVHFILIVIALGGGVP